MIEHNPGQGHPERPDRLRAVLRVLQEQPVAGPVREKPRPATREHIARIHDADYIDRIDALRGRAAQLDPDTTISPKSVDAAYLAAGAAISAVEAVMHGSHSSAFALVRPPGHHAEADRAMGFCLFNNIAIAAAHAISALGCQRALIVDWDVHHGNGTQHAFWNRRDVLVFNIHQHRLFPDTGHLDEIGAGDGAGFTVNAPLLPTMNDAVYLDLFDRLLAPIADAYQPDLVLVSAGFDAHREDPLGGMEVTDDGFAAMCGKVKAIAERHCGGKLALFLEGGYNLNALARSVHACVNVLAGQSAPEIERDLGQSQRQMIKAICDFHAQRWPAVAGSSSV